MKDAQVAKQEEYRKLNQLNQQNQQNHYGPPYQQDRNYVRNDSNKRSTNLYDRDPNQDKLSRTDRGSSTSRDRSNSQMRSPGDNHRNGASFYDDMKRY
jgi:hypothetical protein